MTSPEQQLVELGIQLPPPSVPKGAYRTDHPAVINGCSELFRDVFGADAGTGARSAVGVVSLPLGVAVEIEAVFEVLL